MTAFRAPSFVIPRDENQYLESLRRAGVTLESGAPCKGAPPPSTHGVTRVPVSRGPLGVPRLGGRWLKVLPPSLIAEHVRTATTPQHLYFHPYDIEEHMVGARDYVQLGYAQGWRGALKSRLDNGPRIFGLIEQLLRENRWRPVEPEAVDGAHGS